MCTGSALCSARLTKMKNARGAIEILLMVPSGNLIVVRKEEWFGGPSVMIRYKKM